MSYSFHYNKWGVSDECINLSAEAIINDKKEILSSYQFEYWVKDRYVGLNINMDKISKDEFDEDEAIEDFKNSSDYYDFLDSFTPIYNFVHLLSDANTDDENLILLNRLVGNIVVVVHIEDLDADVIALTGCGMDLSDDIELAYYILDGKSPIKARQIMSLSDDAEKLLKFCRDKAEFDKFVPNYEIISFLDGLKKDE